MALPAQAGWMVVGQDTLANYKESLEIHEDGSLDVTITCSPVNGKVMDLPLEYESIENPKIVSGSFVLLGQNDNDSSPVVEKRGSLFIRLLPVEVLDSQAADSLVSVTFNVPGYFDWKKSKRAYGVVRFSKTFLNTSDYYIRTYELEYMLPKGYLLHGVLKTEPEYNPQKQPVPPYLVEKLDGHYRAALTVNDLSAASRAVMSVEMLKAKRSMLPLIIGIVLSVLYLIFYRDVLEKEKD